MEKMEEISTLIKKSESGDVEALMTLASYYEEGINVEQDDKKAFEYYEKAALQGNDVACNCVGLLYQDGIGVEKDYVKAAKYFMMAIQYGNISANNNLGYLYLNGYGVEKNYNKAYEIFKKFNSEDKYIINILEKIVNGSKVLEINNIGELYKFHFEEMEDNTIVIINSNNSVNYSNYYDLGTCKKILNKMNEILSDIDVTQKEIDVFMQIYIKLTNLITYDHDAYDFENNMDYVLEVASTSRNLIGLLTGNCVCGGHAEILRNMLEYVNIDAKKMSSCDHSFNKVKIDNKWYYCDLTKDIIAFEGGVKISNCLIAKDEFENCLSHIAYNDDPTDNNSDISYPNLNILVKKNLEILDIQGGKKLIKSNHDSL